MVVIVTFRDNTATLKRNSRYCLTVRGMKFVNSHFETTACSQYTHCDHDFGCDHFTMNGAGEYLVVVPLSQPLPEESCHDRTGQSWSIITVTSLLSFAV